MLDCKCYRRWGAELELNTPSGIVVRPSASERQIAKGSDLVAYIVQKACEKSVKIIGWDHVYNNDDWIVKPDNSCGIEINTPVLKGWVGLKSLMKVSEALRTHYNKADDRCSLHVHVNIADLTKMQLASVIAHYIKCEHVFFDSVPASRKNNRYCTLIGLADNFDCTFDMVASDLITGIADVKYYSLNAFHFVKGGMFSINNERKKTIEFRIAEGSACLDPMYIKNWVRLILHFVETTKRLPIPKAYEAGDPWSGLAWLDPSDVMKLLGFDQELSPGLTQVRDWFYERIRMNGYDSDENGIWSNEGRKASRQEFMELYKATPREEARDETLWGERYIF